MGEPATGEQKCARCGLPLDGWTATLEMEVHVACIMPPASPSPAPAAPLPDAEIRDKLGAAYVTIDRIWKALGISTYEDAGGKEISELVAELRARAEKGEAAFQNDIQELSAMWHEAVQSATDADRERDEARAERDAAFEQFAIEETINDKLTAALAEMREACARAIESYMIEGQDAWNSWLMAAAAICRAVPFPAERKSGV